MKRISREINVFNLSAIDLFASAMGAFMLISLVALPYYLNKDFLTEQIAQLTADNERIRSRTSDAQASLSQAQQRREDQQRQLEQLQRQAQQQQQQLQDLHDRLSKTILAVMVNWYTPADIDLHVTTPAGNHYYYGANNRLRSRGGTRPNWPDEEAELSFDAGNAITGTAGIEVWTMANAADGEYRISVDKFANHGDDSPTRVEMAILYGNGVEHKVLADLTGQRDVAVIRVDSGAGLTVNWAF